MTGLKLFQFLQCDCIAKLLQLMSLFYLAQSISILKVCMSLVTTCRMSSLFQMLLDFLVDPYIYLMFLVWKLHLLGCCYCP